MLEGHEICKFTRQNWRIFVKFKNSNHIDQYGENQGILAYNSLEKKLIKKQILKPLRKLKHQILQEAKGMEVGSLPRRAPSTPYPFAQVSTPCAHG